jgi:hypothetical protein
MARAFRRLRRRQVLLALDLGSIFEKLLHLLILLLPKIDFRVIFFTVIDL